PRREIDHVERSVAKLGNEQALAPGINGHVIDAAGNSLQDNHALKHKRCRRLRCQTATNQDAKQCGYDSNDRPQCAATAPGERELANGCHSRLPKANCSTTPASEQASSVGITPTLKRNNASAAAMARIVAKASRLGRTGRLRFSP